MTRREKLAAALLRPINPASVVFLGLYTLFWGLWVANPFWEVFTRASLYDKLTVIGEYGITPEYFWGSIAIFCGVAIIVGAIRRIYRSLVMGAIITFFHWILIGTFYLWGDWQNTGGMTAYMFAAYAAFIYLNLKVNFKDDNNHRHILSD